MKTAENVCLVDEKAKAYCRKLQGKKDSHARAYGLRPDLLETQTNEPCYKVMILGCHDMVSTLYMKLTVTLMLLDNIKVI